MAKFILIVFFIISSFPSFSKENRATNTNQNTVKFHKAENEAERALDYILRLYDSDFKSVKPELLEDYKCVQRTYECEKFFTKSFIDTYHTKYQEMCKSQDKDDPCLFGDGISCGTDYGNPDFGYYTYKIEKDIFYMEQIGTYMGKFQEEHMGKYKMKKENGKWKIDDTWCLNLYEK